MVAMLSNLHSGVSDCRIVGWYYWPLSFGALAFMWLWFFCFAEMICISPLVVLAPWHKL